MAAPGLSSGLLTPKPQPAALRALLSCLAYLNVQEVCFLLNNAGDSALFPKACLKMNPKAATPFS